MKFRTLAATCGWIESALLSAYHQGLYVHIHAQMAIYDNTVGLESFMQKANCISQHLSACHPAEAVHQPASPANGSPVPEPMHVDMSRLSARERARRWTAGQCFYCASPDHYIQACPIKPPRPAVSTLQTDPIIAKLTVLNVQLLTSNIHCSLRFGRLGLLWQLYLPRPHRPSPPAPLTACPRAPSRNHQRKPLGSSCVRFETPPLRLRIGTLHEEEIVFLVLEEATVDLILGRPWLIIRSPEIRWETSEVICWSEFCHQHCLKGIPHPRLQSPVTQVASTRLESPEPSTTPTIPSDYRAFQDVFSKQAATNLPP